MIHFAIESGLGFWGTIIAVLAGLGLTVARGGNAS